MADEEAGAEEVQLAFTKEEWDSAMPALTLAMKDHLNLYRTPAFTDHGDYNETHPRSATLVQNANCAVPSNQVTRTS